MRSDLCRLIVLLSVSQDSFRFERFGLNQSVHEGADLILSAAGLQEHVVNKVPVRESVRSAEAVGDQGF